MAPARVARCEPQHLPSVLSLYERVFGLPARAHFERRYRWSRVENLAPEQTGEWVLLGEGDAVVGYLGALPMPYVVAGQRVWAHTTADFMVDPSHAFHGLTLMRECVRRFPRQVSVDDIPATRALLRFFKAREVLTLARHAKPLDARVLKGRSRLADRVPAALLSASRPALRLVDRLRRPRGLPRAVELDLDDVRVDDFARRQAEAGVTGVHRDRTYYRWRYGAGSPQAGARAFGLEGPDGSLSGYVVVAMGGGPARPGHVLELHHGPGSAATCTVPLLVAAIRALRALGAFSVYAHVPEPAAPSLAAALAGLGFGKRAYRTTLYARPAAPGEPVAAGLLAKESWDVQYGDAEVSHGSVAAEAVPPAGQSSWTRRARA